VDSLAAWALGLVLGFAVSICLYLAARVGPLRRQTQRLLFLFAALLAFATVLPLAATAWVLAAYAGHCEDVGFCSPEWWRPLGLALLLPLGIVIYVLAASVKGFRSARP
jgi:heme A synthase